MTDDDLDPRDELASSHLDGEATPDEAARVATDPDLAARRAVLDDVRRAVATESAPVDPLRRDQAIAAALAAAEGQPVVAIEDRRRHAASRRRVQLVGLAAALALAAGLVLPLLRHHPGHATITAASTPKAADRAAPPEAAASTTTTAAPPEVAGPAGTTGGATALAAPSVSFTVVQLGTYPDLSALTAAVRAQVYGPGAPAPAAAPDAAHGAQTCIDRVHPAGAAGEPVFTGLATVAGRPVVAIVVLDGGVDRLTTVAAAPACSTLASTRL